MKIENVIETRLDYYSNQLSKLNYNSLALKTTIDSLLSDEDLEYFAGDMMSNTGSKYGVVLLYIAKWRYASDGIDIQLVYDYVFLGSNDNSVIKKLVETHNGVSFTDLHNFKIKE